MSYVKELHPHIYKTLVNKGISTELNIISKTLDLSIDLYNYEIKISGEEDQLNIFKPYLDTYIESLYIQSVDKKIPPNMCGLVIGKKGQIIKRISYDSGAKLKLNNKTYILNITGNSTQIDKASNAIDIILKQNVKINIPKDKYGQIIGKGGRMIHKITCLSKAKLSFKDGVLSIYGKQDAIKKAQQLVHDIIDMQDIILNPFEYDKLFDGTNLLIELTDKYQVQVNLTKYSLNVKKEFIDDVRKIISDKLDDSSDIFAESESSSDDDIFI